MIDVLAPWLAGAVRTTTLLLALSVATGVLAQGVTVIGTIDATLDGEEHRWYQIELSNAGVATALSSWARVRGPSDRPASYDVTLQGFLEPRFLLERAIAISLSLTGSLPADCPCRYDDFSASVVFLEAGSMTDGLYVSDLGGAATVVIETFEPVGGEAYRVEGSFAASLPYVPDIDTGPDLDDVVEVAGRFAVERLPREPVDP